MARDLHAHGCVCEPGQQLCGFWVGALVPCAARGAFPTLETQPKWGFEPWVLLLGSSGCLSRAGSVGGGGKGHPLPGHCPFQVADERLCPDVLSTAKEMSVANFRRVPKMPVYGTAQPSSKVRDTISHRAGTPHWAASPPFTRAHPFLRAWAVS